MNPFSDGPRLLADIGGTNARFALQTGPDEIGEVHTYAGADFPGIAEAITRFLEDSGVRADARVRHAAIAIANPIDGDRVTMTNHDWTFSIDATRRQLGLQTFKVVNDFVALAQAVPALDASQRRAFGTDAAGSDRGHGEVMAVLGAGTGLGVAGLINVKGRWRTLASEGGHSSFAPIDAREDAILAFARKKWGHVSYERVASGPGIELIHSALANERAAAGEGAAATAELSTAKIVERALAGDPHALETIDAFCGILGNFAGNVAITFGALGGVYIGGGVVPRLGELFYQSRFRTCFEFKGRFDRYLSTIPTYVITAHDPAFIGVSEILSAALHDEAG